MKIIYSLALLLTLSLSHGQSIAQIDSLNTKICNNLEENVHLKQDVRVDIINRKFITPFLKKYTDTIAQKEAFDRIFFRLQKNCNAFVALLSQDQKKQNDWVLLDKQPELKMTKTQIQSFYSRKKYYYREPDNNIVKVTMDKNQWMEEFNDGTISKLRFAKGENGSFDLYFIESNNETRKNLSIPGDQYHYQMFQEDEGVFTIYIQNKEVYYTFKLYPQK